MNNVFKVLYIDAWADESGWSWNNWHTIGTYDEAEHGYLDHETAFKYFQEEFIKEGCEKLFEVDDDQYNFVLIRRKDQMPIVAIEYGGIV